MMSTLLLGAHETIPQCNIYEDVAASYAFHDPPIDRSKYSVLDCPLNLRPDLRKRYIDQKI